ncbi:MAG: phage baseplate protein [Chloroflexi bacterium]|nr:MAG: phage baseplate protein [Chloroflexota bacterium]
MRDREFIGQGLTFPLQIDQQGGLALARGVNEIEQAIKIILGTIPGERVMRPEFGCRIHELLFAPNNASTRRLAAFYIEEALKQWEPRIEPTEIEAIQDPSRDGTLLIEIKFKVKDTHDQRSIVYPFFLQGEENW